MVKPVSEIAQHCGGVGVFLSCGEKIIHPQSFLPVVDKPGIFENLKMLGHRRLSDIKCCLKLTHACHPVLQYLEHLDPVGVRQRFHDFRKLLHVITSLYSQIVI